MKISCLSLLQSLLYTCCFLYLALYLPAYSCPSSMLQLKFYSGELPWPCHSVVLLKPVLSIHHAHLFCVYLPCWIILVPFKGRDYICWALDHRCFALSLACGMNGVMLRIDIWIAYDRSLHLITILHTLYRLIWKGKSCPGINLDHSLMDSLVFVH